MSSLAVAMQRRVKLGERFVKAADQRRIGTDERRTV